ncbi:MAG: cytochrome P460 family protein [Acidobacteriaceae bacterium]|nr:cytochrome P460 family protein [Acidobacteriaceae bacterium]MBV9502625.1 cytochrome P460 family protein [Acidobacteriaceae bacterium]
MRARDLSFVLIAVSFTAALALVARSQPESQVAVDDGPRFTRGNQMVRPDNYREWIYLSSGLGMSYTPGTADADPSFDNVFVNPSAYKSFVATGRWPEKTIFALEIRQSVSKGSINRKGHYQGEFAALEVHVKDERHFPGKWAFYGFNGPEKTASMIPTSADCYSCHEQHGAVDTVFVQFYPTLLDVAKRQGTIRTQY